MRSLSAPEILRVWETAQGESPLDRALLVLSAASQDRGREDWAAVGIGERDAGLFAVREQTFGPEMDALVKCAACAHPLEIALRTSALCPAAAADISGEPQRFASDAHEVRFRLPNSFDLAQAARSIPVAGDPPATGEWQHALLRQCIVEARRDATAIDFADLPASVLEAVAGRMGAIDPRAEIELALACPACGHRWTELFDIASYLWAEIEARARRLLHAVHLLASAYGWHEAEILALSEKRRQSYLEMIGA